MVTNEYTVLGTGMHYLENGEWKESSPELEEFADGFVARHGAHRGVISRQLLKAGVVDAVDPDGRRLQATPSLLIFRDRVTGDAVELARIVRTEGQLDSPTSVIFPHAFDRLDADVLVKWANHGFSCDIVLREALPDPVKLGLDSELTDFEVITEFYDSEPTAREATTVRVGQKDQTPSAGRTAVHERFEFGKFNVEGGDAALVPAGFGDTPAPSGIPVRRTLYSEGSRRLLIESIPYLEAKELLKAIPPGGARWEANPGTSPGKILPPTLPGAKEAAQTQWVNKETAAIASGSVASRQIVAIAPNRAGLIMDWPAVVGTATSYTFTNGSTYWISGYVSLGGSWGTVNLNPDVVIKYSYGATLCIVGNTYFKMTSDLYRPAVFLSKDDNSLGDVVSGSTGNPLDSPAATALNFSNAGTVYESPTGSVGLNIKHFRIRNASQGIKIVGGRNHNISHGQFVDCGAGVTASSLWNAGLSYWGNLTVVNCLFAKCVAAFESLYYAPVVAHFITFDPTVANAPIVRGPNNNSTLYVWNSIIANVSSMPSGVVYEEDNNDTQSATSWVTGTSLAPFVVSAGGKYYLPDNSPGRLGAHKNAIDLFGVDLANLTVSAPQSLGNVAVPLVLCSCAPIRLSDRMSRGYRYPAADYWANGSTISAPLTTLGGIIIATSGIIGLDITTTGSLDLANLGVVSSINNQRPSNILTRFSTIQEQRTISASDPSLSQILNISANGSAQFRSTQFLSGIQTPSHRTLISHYVGNSSFKIRDCILRSSAISVSPSGGTPRIESYNCLWDKASMSFLQNDSVGELQFRNNLCIQSQILLYMSGTPSWNIRDNVFGDCTFSLSGSLTGYCSHNAFKPIISLPGSPNITLTDLSFVGGDGGKWPYFYPLSGGNLALLQTAAGTGSRSASASGLYNYTTDATPPISNGNGKRLGNNVNIGLHYPAMRPGIPGVFADEDSDGIADIYEDSNGDGTPNTNESSWTVPNTPGDYDNDSLNDDWEQIFGANPLLGNSDGDSLSDWEEAREGTNPNDSASYSPKLLDRFSLNSGTYVSDEGRSSTTSPGIGQLVQSFEGNALSFPGSAGTVPVVYPLNLGGKPSIDLVNGTVRLWYIPAPPFDQNVWCTLVHARGVPSGTSTAYEWKLDVHPASRQIRFSSSLGDGVTLRPNFQGTLPERADSNPEAFDISLSYTSGCSVLAINSKLIESQIRRTPGKPDALGVDLAGVTALKNSPNGQVAIGGRIASSSTFDSPALGVIDDVEWYNALIYSPRITGRDFTPWGALQNSMDLRKYGGWSIPQANAIEIHLRRGWEGPIVPGATPDPYRIERRELGVTVTGSWPTVSVDPRRNVIIDSDVTVGKWYEYRLPTSSKNRGHSIWGYAGATRPATTAAPRYAIVVGVDSELLASETNANGPFHTALNSYMAALNAAYGSTQVRLRTTMRRMKDDENGDGFLDLVNGEALIFKESTDPSSKNYRYKADLDLNRNELWAELNNITATTGGLTKLIVLIGHVTVPMSGSVAEDGHTLNGPGDDGIHPSHEGAWPCDVWYADPDGAWHDNATVPVATGQSRYYYQTTPRIDWALRNVAGDGKFEENVLPPQGPEGLNAGIGRIDFSKMPGFILNGETALAAELRMTKDYLLKATAYRGGGVAPANTTHCFFGFENKGVSLPPNVFSPASTTAIGVAMRQNSGVVPGSGFRDIFKGPETITTWGFHANYGAYNGCLSDVWTIWHASEYIQANSERSRSAFSILNGSYFGDWNHEAEEFANSAGFRMSASNFQRAILTQASIVGQALTGLVTVWFTPSHVLNCSRAAAGFPVGCLVIDTANSDLNYSCRCLSILGDPTLIGK